MRNAPSPESTIVHDARRVCYGTFSNDDFRQPTFTRNFEEPRVFAVTRCGRRSSLTQDDDLRGEHDDFAENY